jgi:hypothetical protein
MSERRKLLQESDQILAELEQRRLRRQQQSQLPKEMQLANQMVAELKLRRLKRKIGYSGCGGVMDLEGRLKAVQAHKIVDVRRSPKKA